MKASAESDLARRPRARGPCPGAALVDECRLFGAPVIVGGGHRWLPDGFHLELELKDERRFGSGFVYLAYRAAPPS